MDPGCFITLIAYVCGLPCLRSLTYFPQEESPSKVARVFKIVIGGDDTHKTFVILEPWDVSVSRDERYGMPALDHDHTESYFVVSPKVCRVVDCPPSQIGFTFFRISTLYSMHSTIAKAEVVCYTRLTPSRSAKKRRRGY